MLWGMPKIPLHYVSRHTNFQELLCPTKGAKGGSVMANGLCRGVDGLEKVTPLNKWQFLVSMLDFWSALAMKQPRNRLFH